MVNPTTATTANQAETPRLPGLIGAVTDTSWPRLSKGRRARLTGLAGGLKGVDLAVFLVMAEHARGDGRGMRASVFTLADEAGYSISPVRRALRRLEADYWVRCVHRSRGGLIAGTDQVNMTSTYTVLALATDPRPKLTKSKRRAALFPDWRERPLPQLTPVNVCEARSQRPTRSPVAATDKRSPVAATDKKPGRSDRQ